MKIFLIITIVVGILNIILSKLMGRELESLGYKFKERTKAEKISNKVKSYIMTFVPILNILILLAFLLIPMNDFIEHLLDVGIIEHKYE